MSVFRHGYPFDPSYGYSREELLRVGPPGEPPGFEEFWRQRYGHASQLAALPELRHTGKRHAHWEEFDLHFRTTDGLSLGGWLLVPKHSPVTRGLVVGHGYGGREGPDYDIRLEGAALLFPCFRGLSRSRCFPIPDNPERHVVHDLDSRERYILGGCVEDVWLSVSALLTLFPAVKDRVGFIGISFSGGVGALAMPWDARIRRGALRIPSFGHHPLRLELTTTGSTRALAKYVARHPAAWDALPYYDAAVAARHIRRPVFAAPALFDPVVPPPAQFAIVNALGGPKEIFIHKAGHFDHAEKAAEEAQVHGAILQFFASL